MTNKGIEAVYRLMSDKSNLKKTECVDDLILVCKWLKAIEIIKNKNVLIYTFKIADNLTEYNIWVCDEEYLTQEEFDLLKEVLG